MKRIISRDVSQESFLVRVLVFFWMITITIRYWLSGERDVILGYDKTTVWVQRREQ